jgi:enolase-phosphatase E1
MSGILLDIEGTTTPISFVYDVLFPFARKHLNAYLPQTDLTNLKQEYGEDVGKGLNPPAWSASPVQYVEWLMDQDRKSTALKKLQGEIWHAGYEKGELNGEVFPDVPPALERWHRQNIDVRIFSSGSILAQRLIFSTTKAGDLTRFLKGYFDTTTGPKNEASSYRQIAKRFGVAAPDIVFISDVTKELDAARSAGMNTLLCVRPGNHPEPPHTHTIITTFEVLS